MKQNKGFTLIELLIVIALMSSVLALVVVSVTEISKKQKQNAYEQVKNQVSVAAEQYFSSNEYFFEGMTNKAKASISVGELVDSGYIGILTDPMTGEKLNNCDSVTVEKENGKYKINEFNKSFSNSCNNQYAVDVREVFEKEEIEEPEDDGNGEEEITDINVELVFYGVKDSKFVEISSQTGWINLKSFKDYDNRTLYICLKINKGAHINSIIIDEQTPMRLLEEEIIEKGLSEEFEYYYVEKKADFPKEKIEYEVQNSNYDIVAKGSISIGKDTEVPYFTGVIIWPCFLSQKIEGKIHDDLSGLAAMYGYNAKGEIFGAYDEVYKDIKNNRGFIYLIPTNGYVRVHDAAGNIVEHKIPWKENDDVEIYQ